MKPWSISCEHQVEAGNLFQAFTLEAHVAVEPGPQIVHFNAGIACSRFACLPKNENPSSSVASRFQQRPRLCNRPSGHSAKISRSLMDPEQAGDGALCIAWPSLSSFACLLCRTRSR